ncbi:hypothetical protein Ais01nite_74800 [Asanoa ishikariensis]|uniref:GNAT family N-acetyltransferase n=1 Tax=Asanoa ishikariensis TaxID=137265 RepID=UPI000B879825|nr:GNAT family N-acetyltransferase [Asanoa ishikariensis]GIF69445.1 hypothetical protein Ais01nite_74800 [Asanoa ishikariensis]
MAGGIVLGNAPNHVPPATVDEVYVCALVASRHASSRGTGRKLLRFAEEQTRAAGIRRLRVDCWACGNGKLVRYYESVGFRATDRFAVEAWQGQVLQMDLL